MSTAKSFNMGRMRSGFALLVAFLISFGALRLGSIATTPNLDWYATLAKPWFTPPNWAFPVVWPILFALMAVALWRVVRISGGWMAGNLALIPFAVQLALNVGWSFAFFDNQDPAGGLVVILLLLLAIVWTMITFWRKDRLAGLLLAPYLVWVVYASLLNAALWRLNA